MQSIRFIAVLTLAAFALSLPSLAKDANSGNFDLTQTVQVGSTVLQPGHYKAEWTGPNTALQISILRNGKTVATADAKMVNLNHPSPYSAVTLKPTANNGKTLDEIQFNNRSETLVFGGEQRSAGE